jgi:hypothetical protein
LDSKNPKITRVLSADDKLAQGIGILARDEWLRLQAFCDMAVNTNPSTDAAMRVVLKMAADATLQPDFAETVKDYASLKDNCVTFDTEIKPGTIDLANDIVQYERRVEVVYGRLISALATYATRETISPEQLKKLAEAWGAGDPPSDASEVQAQFQRYIGILADEAKARQVKAEGLKIKLTKFHGNLKDSGGKFDKHLEVYKTKYEQVSEELKKVKDDIADLQTKLNDARKKQHDEELALETSPLYLLIPILGPFIMGGVLIGVGVDYGLLIEDLKGKVAKMEAFQTTLTGKQTFFNQYQVARSLTEKTAKDIAVILPLVEKLEAAWNALTSDLTDLGKVMGEANAVALLKDWDFASLNLDVAQITWRDLKTQADQYRRFAVAKPASTVDELSHGIRVEKAA